MVTLRDVADEAKLSTATVSRALNDSPSVREQTRMRVREVADRLGYRGHEIAAAMRTGRTKTLGLIIGDISNPFFGSLANSVENAARGRGMSLIVGNGQESVEAQAALVQSMLLKRVDGLIIVPAAGFEHRVKMSDLSNLPVVLLDRSSATLEVPQVVVDSTRAVNDLAERLASVGHRRVLIAVGPQTTSTGRGRRDLLIRAFERSGILETRVIVTKYASTSSRDDVRRGVDEFRPDLIVCGSGAIALGAMRALRDLNLRYGLDIGFATFDDFEWFDCVSPSITAIAQPLDLMAYKAVEVVMGIVEGREERSSRLLVAGEASLCWRDSAELSASTDN